MDPSMIKALKRKQMVEGGLITHRNVFREMKKQNLQTEITMYFHKDTLSVPASPASPSTSSTPPSLPLIKVNPPLPPALQPTTQQEGVRNEDLHDEPLPVNE